VDTVIDRRTGNDTYACVDNDDRTGATPLTYHRDEYPDIGQLSVQEAPWRPKSGNSVKGSKYQTLRVIFHTQSLTHMIQMMDLETVGGFLPPLLELMNDDETTMKILPQPDLPLRSRALRAGVRTCTISSAVLDVAIFLNGSSWSRSPPT
jgi:hypothetical protein